MTQGSPEWFAARCGKVTASRIADIIARNKDGGEKAEAKTYRAELVAERLSGLPTPSFSNAAMRWGTETEPAARLAYEALTGNAVVETGFVAHPSIAMTGASPDGLVEHDGLIELKCPNTLTHINYLTNGLPPAQYCPQMLWQMECTGRDWCDFASFDPRLPAEYRLFVVRFERDENALVVMRRMVGEFLASIDKQIADLRDAVRERLAA